MENNRIGRQELLVARSNKGGGKIYGWNMMLVKDTKIEVKYQWES